MSSSPDLSSFVSRLHLFGVLSFQTGLRIGASRSNRADEPDLPILRDAAGNPYIPGSSLKGALRSYVESMLRSLQGQTGSNSYNLACLSVGKPERRHPAEPEPHVCLTQEEVTILKSTSSEQWGVSNRVPASLKRRLGGIEMNTTGDALDDALRELSCWSCRVFGSPWLASKVLLRDLSLTSEIAWPAEIRDGVAIDRDAGRAAQGMKYQFETLPAGTQFELEMLVENANEAELGLIWLGMAALERGDIPLGGARSRGLGWCVLEPQWERSHYILKEDLLHFLFEAKEATSGTELAARPAGWVQAFGRAIGAVQE